MKRCPFCAEEIQNTAVKCKHCREFLTNESDAADDLFANSDTEDYYFDEEPTECGLSATDSDDVGSTMTQCSGITQKGERCRRMVAASSANATDPVFCPQHRVNPDASETSPTQSSAVMTLLAVVAIAAVLLIAVISGLNRTSRQVSDIGVSTSQDQVGDTESGYVDTGIPPSDPDPAAAGASDMGGVVGTWIMVVDRGYREVTFFSDGTGTTDTGGRFGGFETLTWYETSYQDRPALSIDPRFSPAQPHWYSLEGDQLKFTGGSLLIGSFTRADSEAGQALVEKAAQIDSAYACWSNLKQAWDWGIDPEKYPVGSVVDMTALVAEGSARGFYLGDGSRGVSYPWCPDNGTATVLSISGGSGQLTCSVHGSRWDD